MKYLGLDPLIIARKMLDKAGNAKQRGIEFDLTLKDMHDLFNKGDGLCAYSGKEFINKPDITVERIDPKKGYVRGNVCLVTDNSNQLKSLIDALIHSDLSDLETKEKVLKIGLRLIRQEIKQKGIDEERRISNDETRSSRLASMARDMRGLSKP